MKCTSVSKKGRMYSSSTLTQVLNISRPRCYINWLPQLQFDKLLHNICHNPSRNQFTTFVRESYAFQNTSKRRTHTMDSQNNPNSLALSLYFSFLSPSISFSSSLSLYLIIPFRIPPEKKEEFQPCDKIPPSSSITG